MIAQPAAPRESRRSRGTRDAGPGAGPGVGRDRCRASARDTLGGVIASMRTWGARRWLVAVGGTVATAVVLGVPTDVIPNPVFGRPVAVTWWSYPVLAVSAVLGGLLLATYVRADGGSNDADGAGEADRPARLGGIGGALSFFAIGCPVCNKLVVIALGTVGARQWFEPVQPWLAGASVVLMALALRARLRSAVACPIPARRELVSS